MKLYSALVKNKQTKNWMYILDKLYKNKTMFIKDLRKNGFAVYPYRVRESEEFNRIINETNTTDEEGLPSFKQNTTKTSMFERQHNLITVNNTTPEGRAKAAKKDLEKFGINDQQVSVECERTGHTDYFYIKIKDLTVNKKMVELILNRHKTTTENFIYDNTLYEIYNDEEYLHKIQTYFCIYFDGYKLKNAIKEFLPLAKQIKDIYHDKEGWSNVYLAHSVAKSHIFDDDLELRYCTAPPGYHDPVIGFDSRYKIKLINTNKPPIYYDNVEFEHMVYNEQDLAEGLALCKYQYNFNIDNIYKPQSFYIPEKKGCHFVQLFSKK